MVSAQLGVLPQFCKAQRETLTVTDEVTPEGGVSSFAVAQQDGTVIAECRGATRVGPIDMLVVHGGDGGELFRIQLHNTPPHFEATTAAGKQLFSVHRGHLIGKNRVSCVFDNTGDGSREELVLHLDGSHAHKITWTRENRPVAVLERVGEPGTEVKYTATIDAGVDQVLVASICLVAADMGNKKSLVKRLLEV